MKLVLSRSAVEAQPELMFEFLRAVSDDIEFLRANYPRFDEWFFCKVIPGIYQGERTAVIEQRDSLVAGLLIVKHSVLEKKLCTLRVRPHFENRGLGIRLFEAAFDLLGTERPLLSVAQTSVPKFSRLFAHFGFAQEAVYKGRYLPEVNEFSYNGLLEAHQDGQTLSPYILQHVERIARTSSFTLAA
ncbi:MAG: GNAT family N-acetyltransferase [Burkholderiaceae bacterium]